MSLEASRHLWNARVDPRHRRHAVGMYTHVLDQWGIIYDQPIVLNQRQAGMAIEGVVRQKASTELRHLAVDTHGFTDFAMAAAKLLGFDLCPRLKNLKNRRLHLPAGFKVPAALKPVAQRDVHPERIEEGWDGLARVVASIAGGWTSGMLALERFGSASRHDPVHQTGTHLGKLYRTLFLCDYFTNPSFRRELLRILNYGESVHRLQRAIHFGGIAVARGRRHDELVAISGSLTLLSNLAMAWMTHKLQAVLDARSRVGRPVPSPDVLRHIGPVHSEGINFRGRLHFPIKTYASRILAA
jgi:TnpA family transposase